MRRRTLAALSLAALTVSVLSLAGCSAKPENSPVVRKKFTEVDEMKAELKETTKSLRTISGDVTILKDQISNLRALTPDADGQIDAVRRIQDLESRLSQLEGNPTTTVASNPTATRPATSGAPAPSTSTTTTEGTMRTLTDSIAVPERAPSTTTAVAPPVVQVTNSTKPAEVVKAVTTKETTKPATTKTSTKSTTKSAPKATTTKSATTAKADTATKKPATTARGKYYTIQAGDSLDKIASSNGVTVDDIKKANHLPSGARPLTGQRLFIPPAKS